MKIEKSKYPVDIGLRVFMNGNDHYVAYSKDEAIGMHIDLTGDKGDDEFEEVPQNKQINITYNEDDKNWPEDGVCKTASGWCEWNGKGFLCSEDW